MSVLAPDIVLLSANGADNNTTQPPDWAGYTATAIAVLFYGSNYVPVKKFDTGDGMLFQFYLCLGIWLVGMVVNAIRAFPVFHPTVMLGGAIWTFGNLFAVPIIQTIGMGLGILIWGMFNMLTGWATGRFGILGIPPQVPNSLAFNYSGVAISACASILFFFVKPEIEQQVLQVASSSFEVETRPAVQRSTSDQEGSISVYDDVFGSLDGASNRGLNPSLNASRQREDKQPIVSEPADEPQEEPRRRQPFWMQMSPTRRRIL